MSLQMSMAAAFAITVIATAAFIGATTFFAARSYIRESIRLRLQDIATLAAMHVNVAEASKIHVLEDEKLPEYTRLKAYLERVRQINPEIRFAYLYRVSDSGKVFCVVENEPVGSPSMSHAGDPYPDATPLTRKVYKAGAKAEAEQDFWTDQWGIYLSSYIPVLDASGKVECGLGIDMSAKAVLDFERRFLYSLIGLGVFTAVVVLFASLWYSRRISRPLLLLADDLGRVQRLELDTNIDIHSSVKEVVLMREAIQKMKSSLRSFRKYVPADLVGWNYGLLGSPSPAIRPRCEGVSDCYQVPRPLKVSRRRATESRQGADAHPYRPEYRRGHYWKHRLRRTAELYSDGRHGESWQPA